MFKKHRLQTVLWWAALFLLIAGAGIIFVLSQNNSLLLHKAVRVRDESIFVGNRASYFWISDDSFLTTKEIAQGDYDLLNCNVRDGQQKVVAGASALFSGHEKASDIFWWLPSPDGKWLLTISGSPEAAVYTAGSADGRQQFSWKRKWAPGQIAWNPDGSGWIEFSAEKEQTVLRFFPTAGSHEPTERRFPKRLISAADFRNPRRIWILASPLARSWQDSLEVLELNWPGGTNFVLRSRLAVPKRARDFPHEEMCGNRVAILFSIEPAFPRFVLTGQFPFFRPESRWFQELWIEALDGSGLRKIGRTRAHEGISGVQWTADGKAITFLSGDALWRVPIAR